MYSNIEIKYLKNKPIAIDAKDILKNLIKNVLLNWNKDLFFKYTNNIIELNHDEIVVAIGIIINPIDLKK